MNISYACCSHACMALCDCSIFLVCLHAGDLNQTCIFFSSYCWIFSCTHLFDNLHYVNSSRFKICLSSIFHNWQIALHLQADDNPDIFKTWYPPLEKTLSCLSKLYRCLESAVFTGLAQVLEVPL